MFTPLLTEQDVGLLDLQTYQKVMSEISKISKGSLEDDLTDLPAIYSHYHGLMISSKSLLDEAQDDLEHKRSEIREALRKSGEKVTAISGDDAVMCDEEYRALSDIYRDLKETYSYFKSICSTIEFKKEMLIQLSANQRQETKLYAN